MDIELNQAQLEGMENNQVPDNVHDPAESINVMPDAARWWLYHLRGLRLRGE